MSAPGRLFHHHPRQTSSQKLRIELLSRLGEYLVEKNKLDIPLMVPLSCAPTTSSSSLEHTLKMNKHD